MKINYFYLSLLAIALLFSCNDKKTTTQSHEHSSNNPFIQVKDGQFLRNGKPYYYVGTNFWYGAILGSKGEGGNQARLNAELDSLKALGIDNLRILVGADGENGVQSKVEPTLQKAPGVYNDTLLAGLDNFIDSKNGEWYWSINADGTTNINGDKAGFWKCPYHNSRMCMELIERKF